MRQMLLPLLLLASMNAAAGDMIFATPPKQFDRASGPGQVVEQRSDGSVRRYHEPAAMPKPPKDAAFAAPEASFACQDWTKQRELGTLALLGDALTADNREAFWITLYVKGAMDSRKESMTPQLLEKIDAACAKEAGLTIAEAIAHGKPASSKPRSVKTDKKSKSRHSGSKA